MLPYKKQERHQIYTNLRMKRLPVLLHDTYIPLYGYPLARHNSDDINNLNTVEYLKKKGK